VRLEGMYTAGSASVDATDRMTCGLADRSDAHHVPVQLHHTGCKFPVSDYCTC